MKGMATFFFLKKLALYFFKKLSLIALHAEFDVVADTQTWVERRSAFHETFSQHKREAWNVKTFLDHVSEYTV